MRGTLNSYEGKAIGILGDVTVTESSFRPACCRFEAGRNDGEPSVFGRTELDLILELLEREAGQ